MARACNLSVVDAWHSCHDLCIQDRDAHRVTRPIVVVTHIEVTIVAVPNVIVSNIVTAHIPITVVVTERGAIDDKHRHSAYV